jgi:hypothetical protein
VDHHADLIYGQAHGVRCRRVENFVDDLHLEEVIPRSEGTALIGAAIERALADRVHVGARQAAPGLRVLDVPFGGQIATDQRRGSLGHQLAQFARLEMVGAAATHARRHPAEQCLDEFLQRGVDFRVVQIRAHEPHATIDIVPHASR